MKLMLNPIGQECMLCKTFETFVRRGESVLACIVSVKSPVIPHCFQRFHTASSALKEAGKHNEEKKE